VSKRDSRLLHMNPCDGTVSEVKEHGGLSRVRLPETEALRPEPEVPIPETEVTMKPGYSVYEG
jgi:hypothetical protein